MTDLTRLIEGDLDDFERALLRSATLDRGSERARVRALAVWGALGMELVASSASAGTAASAGVVSGAAMAPAKGALSTITVGLFTKWLGLGAFVGTLTAGGAFAIQRGAIAEGASSPSAMASSSLASVRGESRALEGSAVSEQSDEPSEGETRIARALPREPLEGATDPEPTPVTAGAGEVPSSGAFPVDSGSTLSEELAHLERARRALRAFDTSGALAELSRYSARFPNGALADEATLLTVEARLEAGDTGGARAAARRILDRDRTSPHARRLQALFANKEGR